MSVDHPRTSTTTARLGRMPGPGAPITPAAVDPAVPARLDSRPPASFDHTSYFPKPVAFDRTSRLPKPAALDHSSYSPKPAAIGHSSHSPKPTALDRSFDSRPPGSLARASLALYPSKQSAPATALAASGGTLLFGAVTRLRPSATPPIQPAAPVAARRRPPTEPAAATVVLEPAAKAHATARASTGHIAASTAIDPGATIELRSEIIAALVAETMTMNPTTSSPGRYASTTRAASRHQPMASPPVSAAPSAHAAASTPHAPAAHHAPAARHAGRVHAAVPAHHGPPIGAHPPAIVGPPAIAAVAAHAASVRGASTTLALPPGAVRSRRKSSVAAGAPAEVTVPRPSGMPIDPASIWWSDRPSPPRTPPGSSTPPGPFSWRRARPQRLALVIFLLVASLFCALLAPVCWIVASTELGGIERGQVEDGHRGLLALARIWGAFATCLLVVLAIFMISVIAQSSAHGL